MFNRIKKENYKKRRVELDIIRCFALLCVISVHFFLNTGYYSEIILGKRLYIMTLMQSFLMICVPLFIILTGYLKNKKEVNKKYYYGIINIVIIYIIASIIQLLFKIFYLKQDINIQSCVKKIFDFSAANYSWYIKMYLGLFLMIPFLNIVFNNLKSKKEAKVLIYTMLILTALPGVVNIYRISPLDWWIHPSSNKDYITIIPNWWTDLYPITYYFIGCYLSKYKLKISTKRNIIYLIVFSILFGSFCYYRNYNSVVGWEGWILYGSLFVVINSVLTFNLLLKINFKKEHHIIETILMKMSNAVLCAYLISWIFDTLVYTRLNKYIPLIENRIYYFPLVVIIIYVLSILGGMMINVGYGFAKKIISKIKYTITKE